jgi:hypothetical protein
MPNERGERGLHNEVLSIKIRGRTWKIGDKVVSVLGKIVKKKEMAQKFPDLDPSTVVEGHISGFGATRKICVTWRCDSRDIIIEYSKRHCLFIGAPQDLLVSNAQILRERGMGNVPVVPRQHLDQVQEVIESSEEERSSDSEQEESAGINLLEVKNRKWEENRALDPIDASAELGKYLLKPRVRWDGRMHHSCLEYFDLFFP